MFPTEEFLKNYIVPLLLNKQILIKKIGSATVTQFLALLRFFPLFKRDLIMLIEGASRYCLFRSIFNRKLNQNLIDCTYDHKKRMLGTFPRVFSQVTTYQMCDFPSGNFPSLFQPQRSALSLFQPQRLAPQQQCSAPTAAFGASEGLT